MPKELNWQRKVGKKRLAMPGVKGGKNNSVFHREMINLEQNEDCQDKIAGQSNRTSWY